MTRSQMMQHSASRDYVSASTLLPPINQSQAQLNSSVDGKHKDEYGHALSPRAGKNSVHHPSGIPSSKQASHRRSKGYNKAHNVLVQSAQGVPTS